jgi:hypothetical protein
MPLFSISVGNAKSKVSDLSRQSHYTIGDTYESMLVGRKEAHEPVPAPYQDDLEENPDGPRKDGQKGKILSVADLDTHSPVPPPYG